jgi:hypothetical protein
MKKRNHISIFSVNHQIKKILSVSIVIILLVLEAKGQRKDTLIITPGANHLQTYKLINYSSKYDFFSIKDSIETKIGYLEDNFSINKKPKNVEGLRVCKISFGVNQILDSGLCRLKDLSPIYHRSIQTKKILNLVFAKTVVQGYISKNDGSNNELINYPVEIPLFDSFYEDIIAKSVNLENGYIFKFPEYIYERGGTVWSLGQVMGNEKMKDHLVNLITIWTVQFYEFDNEKRITRTTIFKINESDRGILSREYISGNNRIVMRKSIG